MASKNLKERRAQSVIIGALLFMLMAVVLGGIVMYWTSGMVSTAGRGHAEELEHQAASKTEVPKLLDVAFDYDISDEGWSGEGLILLLANTGTSSTIIDKVYIDGSPEAIMPSSLQLGPNKVATLLVQYDWEEGSTYHIKVVSKSGAMDDGYFTAKGKAIIPEFPASSMLVLGLSLVLSVAVLKGRRCLGPRRGVSYIISVLLMALVITSLSALVLSWGMGQVFSAQSSYSLAIESDIARLKERFVIEHIDFQTPDTVTVFIKNVGLVSLTIDSFYFNDTRIDVSPPLQLAVGRAGSFTVTTPSFSEGDVVRITVVSLRGNTVALEWKVE